MTLAVTRGEDSLWGATIFIDNRFFVPPEPEQPTRSSECAIGQRFAVGCGFVRVLAARHAI